jgi:hypothetical protein
MFSLTEKVDRLGLGPLESASFLSSALAIIRLASPLDASEPRGSSQMHHMLPK